jgi:hypothetical protein
MPKPRKAWMFSLGKKPKTSLPGTLNQAERAELFAIVEGTKKDIVLPKDQGGA